jgi:hypothetical protein
VSKNWPNLDSKAASMNQRVARAARPLQTAWLALLSVVLAARYVWVYLHHPLGPDNDLPATGWFGWADQSAYLAAARAWATGNLDPYQHLYPSGYALLAAPFVWLMPADPFVIPNLLCWVGSLWLFAALGARLAGGIPGARAISGTVFFLVTVAELRAFYSWEVPWTSTPAATLTFASLLLAIRSVDEERPRLAWAAALLAGLIVLFRPTDALVIVPAVGVWVLAGMQPWRGWRPAAVLALGAGCAVAVGPALLVATHVATHGWSLGYYFAMSRRVGFEWRLLPLRWVTLLLSPRPLYPQGEGYAEVYWFVLPGLAGIVAMVLGDTGRRFRHAVVGGAAIAFLCLYLCYRDLHVLGLFLFQNQHYLKWTLPLFGLYALALPYLLVLRRRVTACVVAVAVVASLSCWRAELVAIPAQPPATVLAGGEGLALPRGMKRVADAVLAASPDDFLGLYFGKHTIEADGQSFDAGIDFKLIPVPFGFMMIPLRPLPGGPSELHLAAPIRLSPAAVVVAARQAIVFGLPCLIAPGRPVCRYKTLLAPP